MDVEKSERDIPTILCVDDEQIILFCLKRQIQYFYDGECRVEVAESGEEALEIIEEMEKANMKLPQVIISDQIMPTMKGHELLISIHEKYPDIVKIMITGMAQNDEIQQAVETANLYKVIDKPWGKELLIDAIKEGLNQSRGLN